MNYDVFSNGDTVWVNASDGCCIARFSPRGIDIHHNAEQQMAGKTCLDCSPGPCRESDWDRFRAVMKEKYSITIEERHKPRKLAKDMP